MRFSPLICLITSGFVLTAMDGCRNQRTCSGSTHISKSNTKGCFGAQTEAKDAPSPNKQGPGVEQDGVYHARPSANAGKAKSHLQVGSTVSLLPQSYTGPSERPAWSLSNQNPDPQPSVNAGKAKSHLQIGSTVSLLPQSYTRPSERPAWSLSSPKNGYILHSITANKIEPQRLVRNTAKLLVQRHQKPTRQLDIDKTMKWVHPGGRPDTLQNDEVVIPVDQKPVLEEKSKEKGSQYETTIDGAQSDNGPSVQSRWSLARQDGYTRTSVPANKAKFQRLIHDIGKLLVQRHQKPPRQFDIDETIKWVPLHKRPDTLQDDEVVIPVDQKPVLEQTSKSEVRTYKATIDWAESYKDSGKVTLSERAQNIPEDIKRVLEQLNVKMYTHLVSKQSSAKVNPKCENSLGTPYLAIPDQNAVIDAACEITVSVSMPKAKFLDSKDTPEVCIAKKARDPKAYDWKTVEIKHTESRSFWPLFLGNADEAKIGLRRKNTNDKHLDIEQKAEQLQKSYRLRDLKKEWVICLQFKRSDGSIDRINLEGLPKIYCKS